MICAKYIYGSIILFCFHLPLTSQDIYWIGGTGNWDNTANWSNTSGGSTCSCLPGPNDFVHIEETLPASVVTLANGDSASIKEIQVETGAQLKIGTSATIQRSHLEITAPSPRGLDAYGEVYVFGSINIYDATGLSVLVREGGYLRIREGGLIYIDIKNNAETKGVTTRGTLILDRKPLNNPGKLEINQVNGRGLFCTGMGTTQNNGRIQIIGITDNYGMSSEASVVNDSTGVLSISDCSDGALSNDSAFINKGLVTLNAIDGTYSLANYGNFKNYKQVEIVDCPANLNIFNTDTFINHAAGEIRVSGLTSSLQDGIRNLEWIENYGTINISGIESADAIANLAGVGYSYFYNKPCAKIFLTKLYNETYFENEGLLALTAEFSANGDILSNKGIIEDRSGSFEPYNNITNDGIIIHPLHGEHVLGIPSQGIVLGTSPTIMSGTTLFFDSLLTTSMGSYSQADNEWLPNGFAGVSELYIETNILGCPDSFISKIALNKPVAAACPDPGNTTIYLLQQTDWFNPYHWSQNQVPTPCFSASVINGTIDAGKIGRAREFRVNPGNSLTVNGELDVSGQ